jgi:hypothetical protein
MGRLDNYEEVKDRLPRFWDCVKQGRLVTEVLDHSENWDQVVMKASLFDWGTLIATGIAMDWKGKDNQANKTNWVEVAETSAIGKAIANSQYQDPNAKRPSREEMEVAFDRQDALESPSDPSKSQDFSPKPTVSDSKPAWVVQLETRFGNKGGTSEAAERGKQRHEVFEKGIADRNKECGWE